MQEIVAQEIVAIDGGAGTGKSTTAKQVAARLGYTYLDTGAMYRALTWQAMRSGIPPQESEDLERLLQATQIGFDGNQTLVDGENRSAEIRSPQVSAQVSLYAALPMVRSALTAQQRSIGRREPCVLDGRDIGTVVFPDARYKFFFVTNLEVRARRRFEELQDKGEPISLKEVRRNLEERDAIDASRETAPLKKADDAIEVDTSSLTIQEEVELVLRHIEKRHCERSAAIHLHFKELFYEA
jgi:cytidylate kinase